MAAGPCQRPEQTPPSACPPWAWKLASPGPVLLLQDQEKALDKYEDVVRGLQRRGQQVVPLKYRRETPLKPIPVEALCDFEGDQVSRYLEPQASWPTAHKS